LLSCSLSDCISSCRLHWPLKKIDALGRP
jgi:hypothetical protein